MDSTVVDGAVPTTMRCGTLAHGRACVSANRRPFVSLCAWCHWMAHGCCSDWIRRAPRTSVREAT
eukprot:5037028-Prymnesium_polylepis.1